MSLYNELNFSGATVFDWDFYHKEYLNSPTISSSEGDKRLIAFNTRDKQLKILLPPKKYLDSSGISISFTASSGICKYKAQIDNVPSINTPNYSVNNLPFKQIQELSYAKCIEFDSQSSSWKIANLKPSEPHWLCIDIDQGTVGRIKTDVSFRLLEETAKEYLLGRNDPSDYDDSSDSSVYEPPKIWKYAPGEPDWHRLARHEKIEDTPIGYRRSHKVTDIDVSWYFFEWDEPDPYYNALYPENKVMGTHNGLLYEIDDTPDNRRFHRWHPSNTFEEISEEGHLNNRNHGDRFILVDENFYKLIEKNFYETIRKSCFRLIKNNNWSHTIGNELNWVQNSKITYIDSNRKEEIGANNDIIINKGSYVKASETYNVQSKEINMDADVINLNCGTSLSPLVPSKEETSSQGPESPTGSAVDSESRESGNVVTQPWWTTI